MGARRRRWFLALVLLAGASCAGPGRAPDPRVARAEAFTRVESWHEAAALWSEIYYASRGRDIDAGLQAASAMLEAGAGVDAWTLLVDVVARAPENADAFELLGRANEAGGDAAAARGNYVAAVELDPRRAFALQRIGDLDCRAGDYAKGLEALERSAGLDPDDLRTRVLLGMRLLEAGRTDRAVLFLDGAIDTDAASDLERMQAARTLGADPRIVPWVAPVARRDPLNAEASRLLGESLFLRGQQDDALAYLEQAAQADPGDVEALASLARALHAMGRSERAKAVVIHGRGLELTPWGGASPRPGRR